MTLNVRNNVWNNGGTFSNPDLLWYARGVEQMQARALDDPSSWWFFAAIHGHNLDDAAFPGWGAIPGSPDAPTSPRPPMGVQSRFWRQCQHQSWFFPPWHRGYLLALEAHLRVAITQLGGPGSWSLPFWNYFGPADQHEMPPAFSEPTLPDGSPNPLFVTARYGPHGNGDIFIPIPLVNEECQEAKVFAHTIQTPNDPGYGGPVTGFLHGGGTSGKLENNPHNFVHVLVGGRSFASGYDGLMSDAGLAALDPIFYMHHCNIDRMWALWNEKGNANPSETAWRHGPMAQGDREFVMPMPDESDWVFTASEVESISLLGYTYEDLPQVDPAPPEFDVSTLRMRTLGLTERAESAEMAPKGELELLGTHDGHLSIKSSGVYTLVRLDEGVRQKIIESFDALANANEAAVTLPDRVFLQLENVKGTRDANLLDIFVNDQAVGSVSLFGLRQASQEDGHHAGAGLTYSVDITSIVDLLYLSNAFDVHSLDVRINPQRAMGDEEQIVIGRVSAYRLGQR